MPGPDLVLAGVVGELLQEFQVGEAQAHGLDFDQDLVRAGLEDFLLRVQYQLARPDQLYRVLGRRDASLGVMVGQPMLSQFRTELFSTC